MKARLVPVRAFTLQGAGAGIGALFQKGPEWNGMIEVRAESGEAMILRREESRASEIISEAFSDGGTDWTVVKCSPSLIEYLLTGQQTEELANQLLEVAKRIGQIVTIEQRPLQPLAMGNYETVVSVRPARGKS